jgi:N-acetylneuraminic acid mutarotase
MKYQAKHVLSFLAAVSMSLIVASSIFPIIDVAYPQTTALPDTWKSVAPMPTARAQLGVAVANGKIYAIGGSANDPQGGPAVLNVTEEYNPGTNTWTTKASMPTARHSFGIAVFQDKIYCMGGSTNGPVLAVNEVYDPATDTWETKTPMHTARAALSTNTVNGKIYLMGGNPENTTNEVYDPVSDSWTTGAQIPLAPVYSESAVVGGKIYLFGGLSNLNATQIYNPETDTWTSGAPLPTGSAEGAAAATEGVNAPVRIYVMGGQTTFIRNGYTYGNITDLNQVYDPESNTWTRGASLPIQLWSFGLTNVNDTFYAIGGFPKLIDFLNTNYQYTPIGYGNPGGEPSSSLQDHLLVAIVVAAVIIVAVVVLIRYRKRVSKSF